MIRKTINKRMGMVLMMALCLIGTGCKASADESIGDALFAEDKVCDIRIDMSEEAWKEIVGKPSDKEYHVCSVTIDGVRLDSVVIRTKGASSLDDVKVMKSDRYSFTLKLNKYRKGQKYSGMTKLLLNNNIWDATQMKDAIVYDMCRYISLPAPRTNYARVTLNGSYFGCYLLVEPVDKHFCKRNYKGAKCSIYKPYHNLAYTGEDMGNYKDIADFAKVNGGDASMRRVVAALRSVHELKDIDSHIDVEAVMKYMAVQSMAVNYDCMTGRNVQNYYLRESKGKLSLIPWDYNLAWGGYPEEDGEEHDIHTDAEPADWEAETSFDMSIDDDGYGREAASRIVNLPIDVPFFGDPSRREFFMNLLAVNEYKAMYYHYLDLLCNQYIIGGGLEHSMSAIKDKVGSYIGTERNAFYDNARFHSASNTLHRLLVMRAKSVIGQMDGSIPATWEGQKEHPDRLIDSDSIHLTDIGGLMVK